MSHQGEFRGDFTRDTFHARKHFRRVFLQQGRVQLDADWNEQTSILLHYIRALAADLIGPHGGAGDGFAIAPQIDGGNPVKLAFLVRKGRYYVDGILCENDVDVAFAGQTYAPFPDSDLPTAGKSQLAFLDVWERHVTHEQDLHIREVALGGPDTASRAQVVAQVKLLTVTADSDLGKAIAALKDARQKPPPVDARFQSAVDAAFAALPRAATTGTLRARAALPDDADQPCTIAAESRYRRASNQLYRVEIHQGSPAPGAAASADRPVTFKWSRDNGSVTFAIVESTGGDQVKLATLGRDDASRLHQGDWVEVVDDEQTLQGTAGPLFQVASVQPDKLAVTLRSPQSGVTVEAYEPDDPRHPLLRRWDHGAQSGELSNGAVLLTQGDDEDVTQWIVLEDGVQIQFPSGPPSTYRAGDYWLIPARTATGDVEWPKQRTATGEIDKYAESQHPIPAALPPHGVEHRYAPLARLDLDATGAITDILDLRHVIPPL